MATAAPDQVKHNVIYQGILDCRSCVQDVLWKLWKGFRAHEEQTTHCGLTVQILRQKEFMLLLYTKTGR